jgi:TolB-like protein
MLAADMPETHVSRTIALDGERVRTQRLRAGLTREALSAKSFGADALSVATIKRAESGKPLYASSVACLARNLDVPVEELLSPPQAGSQTRSRSAGRGASIAIMPFSLGESELKDQIFANGFVEELINRLSSFWFPVIARGSTFSWQTEGNQPADVHQVLGADYLLRGSVRSAGAQFRITAQLYEAASGRVLWSASFDVEARELFALRDRIVAQVVSEVGNQVLASEAEHSSRAAVGELDAWRVALRGAWHFHRSTAEDLVQARAFFQRAIADDPQLAFARYLLVLSHQHDLLNQWTADPRATLQEMRRASVEFERASPGNPWMYVATAYTAVALGERTEARDRLLEALEADGNSVPGHALYGQVLAMGGQYDQGLHELELARTLSPRDPGTWAMLMTTALAHFAAQRYDAAVDWARRAIANRPQVPFTYATLAASLALRGDLEEARATLGKLVERQGRMGRRGITAVVGATEPEIAGRFLLGLRLAGMPEES